MIKGVEYYICCSHLFDKKWGRLVNTHEEVDDSPSKGTVYYSLQMDAMC